MSKIGISISIDVTKIDKARLYKGKKGTYLDLTTFIDTEQADQYDNHGFITQSPSKDEREQKVKMPILGNCKVFYRDGGQERQQPAHETQPAPSFEDFDDDLAF